MKLKQHREAERLRKSGFSVKEIAKRLDVSQSTASLWAKNIPLSHKALQRLKTRVMSGPIKSAKLRMQKTSALNKVLEREAAAMMSGISIPSPIESLICALLYWCEGAKSPRAVAFTNSDPALVRVFADLLVNNFGADRLRLHCRLHLHEYHNETVQRDFWSKAIGISTRQFGKTYWKPHTGVRQREGYPGCISLRFYDTIVARKLMYIAQEYLKGA